MTPRPVAEASLAVTVHFDADLLDDVRLGVASPKTYRAQSIVAVRLRDLGAPQSCALCSSSLSRRMT